MKPVAHPISEPGRAGDAFDNARRRVNASASSPWSREVEERQERPAPRFSSFSTEEEPRGKRFSFKSVALIIVLISFALFGYSWYRGKSTASVAPDQGQAPAGVAQQQPEAQAANNAAPVAAAAPTNTDQTNNSEAQPASPEQAANAEEKAAAVPAKTSSQTIAADTTTDVGLPPAPLVVKGGGRQPSNRTSREEEIAPPSLGAITHTAKPNVAGVVSAAPVEVPKLAAPAVPAAPKRIRVSQGVTQGLLIHQVRPQYPAMARETRVEGDVLLEAVIGKDGTVSDLQVISGPSLLIPPALRAVRQWRYKPYLLNGEPVEVETQIKLQFRL
jgi:TonB family protein